MRPYIGIMVVPLSDGGKALVPYDKIAAKYDPEAFNKSMSDRVRDINIATVKSYQNRRYLENEYYKKVFKNTYRDFFKP